MTTKRTAPHAHDPVSGASAEGMARSVVAAPPLLGHEQPRGGDIVSYEPLPGGEERKGSLAAHAGG